MKWNKTFLDIKHFQKDANMDKNRLYQCKMGI